jgi:FkbM family methyltransferase
MHRFPSKKNALTFLRESGVDVGTVIDVGTHAETLDLREVFHDKRHILFEPADEFFPAIKKNYEGMDYELAPLAVSNADGVANLRKISIDGGEISHSKIEFGDDPGLVEVPTVRLDTFLRGRDDLKPYLVKIDVDGFEMPILEGIGASWADVSCVIVEATQTTFADRLNYVLGQGFQLFDIVDQCYYGGVFAQADIILVANRLWQNPRLRPWETLEFAWDHWVPIASFEGLVNP